MVAASQWGTFSNSLQKARPNCPRNQKTRPSPYSAFLARFGSSETGNPLKWSPTGHPSLEKPLRLPEIPTFGVRLEGRGTRALDTISKPILKEMKGAVTSTSSRHYVRACCPQDWISVGREMKACNGVGSLGYNCRGGAGP